MNSAQATQKRVARFVCQGLGCGKIQTPKIDSLELPNGVQIPCVIWACVCGYPDLMHEDESARVQAVVAQLYPDGVIDV